jgi:hypothetical protein
MLAESLKMAQSQKNVKGFAIIDAQKKLQNYKERIRK